MGKQNIKSFCSDIQDGGHLKFFKQYYLPNHVSDLTDHLGVALGHDDSKLLISFGNAIQGSQQVEILQTKYPPSPPKHRLDASGQYGH